VLDHDRSPTSAAAAKKDLEVLSAVFGNVAAIPLPDNRPRPG
jgi:hypothetical protein